MSFQLYIDTSDNTQSVVRFLKNGQIIQETIVKKNQAHSQTILPGIEEILKKFKINPRDLSKISVNKGPGSYTGLRVGLSIANAMNWVLDLKTIDQLDQPVYTLS